MTLAPPLFAHLDALTDAVGLFEHARGRVPRTEHAYCVDDVARGLIAVCRQDPRAGADGPATRWADLPRAQGGPVPHRPAGRPDPAVDLPGLAVTYARFLGRAQDPDGAVVNRQGLDGARHGEPGLEDCWGRMLWALGTAAARGQDSWLVRWARDRFRIGCTRRSPWPRAMAFAGLGAAELLRVDPGHEPARSLLRDAALAVDPDPDLAADVAHGWPWPERRLSYANAVLPDVLLAAGDCLHDDRLVARGLALLGWLLDLQTAGGHLSLTPAAGRAPGDPAGPAFDQQPIEAATLADACARAHELTGDPRWSAAVESAAAWFFGRNDSSTSLYDPQTGGCCDGLEVHGRNENQGAESTLALITTVQHSSRLRQAAG